MQNLKSAGERGQGGAGGNQIRYDLQSTKKVFGTIGFCEAGMAVLGGQNDLRYMTGRIENAELSHDTQLTRDVGAETAVGQLQIDDRKVRCVVQSEGHGLGHRSGDAAHVVTVADQDLLGPIGGHQIILGDQYFPQGQYLPTVRRALDENENYRTNTSMEIKLQKTSNMC
jgi:hypothetical protein